jgi:anti-anti-sigma regulatory factor
MPANPSQLLYAVSGPGVMFRLPGRPSLDISHHLRSSADRLMGAGHRQFTLDLAACPSVDSTFIGVLLYLVKGVQKAAGDEGSVCLLNLGDQVRRQIDTLGVLDRFRLATADAGGVQFETVNVPAADKAGTTRVCLEAHRNLIEACSSNAARFQDVIKFLEEDLNKPS